MKKTFFCILFIVAGLLSESQQRIITLSNPLAVSREDEVIEIPWATVLNIYPAIDTTNFKVINVTAKKELEYQLEYKGTKEVHNLLVQLSIPPNGRIELQIIKGRHKIFVQKTYCRYVPERKDDFSWENDLIAHRIYGKALEKSPDEMAYGTDVWVKRTDRMILNERYKRGEYHIDHGDGMDYYHVGLTLGAGGIAPYINDTIWYSKNYTDWKILDNGPLRSTFQVSYDEWNAAGRKVKLTKIISIDANSQLSKNEIRFETSENKPLPVVVGIVKRKEPGNILLDEKKGIMGYWEPQHGADGTTGVGCILTTLVSQMMVEQGQILAETNVTNNVPMIYYSGAAWDKAGKITSAMDWFRYLQNFETRTKNPVTILENK